jgi:selenoprotein W-related protein
MDKKIVRIVYCQPCGYMPKALDMAQKLLESYGMVYNKKFGVSLEPGDQGIFDVYLDDRLIFSKKEEGRLPEPKEIVEKLK